jgi:hypothetical protein
MFSSCTSNPIATLYFREFNGPSIKELRLKRISSSEIVLDQLPSSLLFKQSAKISWDSTLKAKNLCQLGISQYGSESQANLTEIRKAAVSLKAKYVYVNIQYIGQRKKIVSVPIAYTPGRTINSTSDTYGQLIQESSSYGVIGSNSYYGNSYGSANYQGTTNNFAYIPSSTTYAPMAVDCLVYQMTVLFCTPESALSEDGLVKLQNYKASHTNH